MSVRRHATPASESLRRAAAAAWEALPAILLAAALLMPALAAMADRTAPTAPATDVGHAIAAQGDRALVEIRAEARQSLRDTLILPKLP